MTNEINWGGDTGRYETQVDPDGDGRARVLVDTSDGTVLLEWDETAGEWVSRGPVNLSGEDLTGVGEIDAESVNTGGISGTVEVGDGDSIQDAADNATGPVEIKVRPDWDPSVETYPITIYTGDTPPILRGPGHVGRDPRKQTPTAPFFDLGGVSSEVFELIGEESDGTTHNWAPNAHVSGFAFTGAAGLLSLKDVDSGTFSNLYGYGMTGPTYHLKQDSESNIWNTFINCHSMSGSDVGVLSESGSLANATDFIGCVVRDHDDIGVDWTSGANMNWFGGTVERNGAYNVDIAAPSATLFGVYFEPGGSATADVIFRGSVSDGGRVLSSRFQGRSTGTERAVIVNPGNGIRVDYNTFQNYAGGFFQVSSGEGNVLGRHNHARDSTPLLRSDAGTRTRYGDILGGGPLGGVDIESVSGAFAQQMAVHNGPNQVNETLWIWDKGNSEWMRCDGGASVTPT